MTSCQSANRPYNMRRLPDSDGAITARNTNKLYRRLVGDIFSNRKLKRPSDSQTRDVLTRKKALTII